MLIPRAVVKVYSRVADTVVGLPVGTIQGLINAAMEGEIGGLGA